MRMAFAILGDGAPRDLDALALQQVDDAIVAERLVCVLAAHRGWRIRDRTDSEETTTPGVRAGSADVKKYFSSKMPRGVVMYLFEVTRLTVLSCSSVATAMSRSTSGFSALTP